MPSANTQRNGATASTARAAAGATLPAATMGPAPSRASSRPAPRLASTDAVTPTIRSTPSALSGSCQLSRIDGHSRPRVELGTATLR